MNDKYIPLGGGNGWAIMATGIPMFLFYLCGWSVVGTIFLILFLIAGVNSLFPLIAAFLALARLCVVHSVDGAVLGALIFWIVILLLFELAARFGGFDEGNEKTSKGEKK